VRFLPDARLGIDNTIAETLSPRGPPDQPDRGADAVERKVTTMARASQQPSFPGMFDSQPQRRLFFGIWPDALAGERLTRLMDRLHNDGIMPGRPVETHRLHATLHHLGDFADQIPPSLLPAAGKAAATVKYPPFEVVFDRIGGTRGQLLLRASDGSVPLGHFRQTLSATLIKAGLRRYINPTFAPHVTLSYDFSDAAEMSIEPIAWTVREFVLVESLPGQHRHVEHGRWPVHA
jgi:RNA 2',3'-cyclic 3'-phosphodiesterase